MTFYQISKQLHEYDETSNTLEVWQLFKRTVHRLEPIKLTDLNKIMYKKGPLIFKFVHNQASQPGQFLVNYEIRKLSKLLLSEV